MRPVPPSFIAPPHGCHCTLYRDGRHVVLHGRHKDQAAAFAAFQAFAERGVAGLVVRLDNDAARPVTVLRACGFNPDALEHDLAFRADVICACIRGGR
jgi:hypothetical protein